MRMQWILSPPLFSPPTRGPGDEAIIGQVLVSCGLWNAMFRWMWLGVEVCIVYASVWNIYIYLLSSLCSNWSQPVPIFTALSVRPSRTRTGLRSTFQVGLETQCNGVTFESCLSLTHVQPTISVSSSPLKMAKVTICVLATLM